jgi:nucleoside-diphosphate-sugar epimerase
MTAPRVAVLGATGFLGRHIRAAFAAEGCAVLAVSRRPAPGHGRHLPLDLVAAAPRELTELLAEERPAAVVNAVGMAWRPDERLMYDTNAAFVGRLAEAVARLPEPPRLVHLGSAHEYGPVPEGTEITEQHPPQPDSVYGRTKLLGTRAALACARPDGPGSVVLRIANVCGPGSHRESLLGRVAEHLAALAGTSAADTAPPPLRLTELRAQRDFVDVRDVAAAVVAAAQAPPAAVAGQIVNIAGGQAVPVRRLVERLVALSGVPTAIVEERPAAAAIRSRAVWQQLDISRARQLLDWKPRRDLDESLRDMLAAVSAKGTP